MKRRLLNYLSLVLLHLWVGLIGVWILSRWVDVGGYYDYEATGGLSFRYWFGTRGSRILFERNVTRDHGGTYNRIYGRSNTYGPELVIGVTSAAGQRALVGALYDPPLTREILGFGHRAEEGYRQYSPEGQFIFTFIPTRPDSADAKYLIRRSTRVALPFWFLVAVTGIWPVCWLNGIRVRRRRRVWASTGHCAGCGYDLRGSPDGCPECGAGRPRQPAHVTQ